MIGVVAEKTSSTDGGNSHHEKVHIQGVARFRRKQGRNKLINTGRTLSLMCDVEHMSSLTVQQTN